MAQVVSVRLSLVANFGKPLSLDVKGFKTTSVNQPTQLLPGQVACS